MEIDYSDTSSSHCISVDQVRRHVNNTSYLTVVSSCLSIFGSSLIILSFLLWKDVRRSMARIILLFLALADLGAGLAYFISSVGHLSRFKNESGDKFDEQFCIGSSFITIMFSLSSYFWTAYLAIYFFVALVLKKPRWSYKLLVVFNITAWIIPLVICIAAVFMGILGDSSSRLSGSWCFVSFDNYRHFHYSYETFLLLEGIYGKYWEIIAFLVIVTCYTVIFCVNRRICSFQQCFSFKSKSSRDSYYPQINKALSNAISKIDLKLLLIPFLFLLLRVPGFYRYFLSISPVCRNITYDNENCVLTRECFQLGRNYDVIYVQALFEPLQGFVNALLFVFFSKVIMHRFLSLCCCCWSCCKRRSKQSSYTESLLTSSSGTEERNQSPFSNIDRPSSTAVTKGKVLSDRSKFEDDIIIANSGSYYGSMLNGSINNNS